MQDNSWGEAFHDIGATVVHGLVRLWKQDVMQVGLALGLFAALALPLLILIALLWYLDSTGWRPQDGFYKIGLSPADAMDTVQALGIGVGLLLRRP